MFKLNSDKTVLKHNASLIHPNLGANGYKYRTFALTSTEELKLEKLRAKYKVSRSAILRILLDNVTDESVE